MQSIEKTQLKTQENLDKIKKELNKLIKMNKENEIEFQKIKKIINNINLELKKYEENIEFYKNTNIDENTTEENLILRKKITIKNHIRSNSFSSWMLNNNEL